GEDEGVTLPICSANVGAFSTSPVSTKTASGATLCAASRLVPSLKPSHKTNSSATNKNSTSHENNFLRPLEPCNTVFPLSCAVNSDASDDVLPTIDASSASDTSGVPH